MSRPWLTSSGCCSLLLLVGRRPLEPADRRDRREQPGELGVLRAVALDEQRAALRVEPEGEQRGGHLARPRPQDAAVVGARQRVVVDDAVDRLVLGLEPDVVADRARGRCRGGRCRTAGCPRRSAARRRAPREARGPERGRSSWAASVADGAHPATARRPFGPVRYHSADVATRPGPRHERRPPARRRPRRRDGRPRGRPGAARDADDLTPRGRRPLELAGIAVRDLDRARAAGLPAELLTDAPAHLVADARDRRHRRADGRRRAGPHADRRRARRGQAVVTANKHVIAHHGPELEAIARRTGAALRFEAAVGGGIPVLGPLATDLAANRVDARSAASSTARRTTS